MELINPVSKWFARNMRLEVSEAMFSLPGSGLLQSTTKELFREAWIFMYFVLSLSKTVVGKLWPANIIFCDKSNWPAIDYLKSYICL